MAVASHRVWDETPQDTRFLKLTTKLSDLGSPMSKKSILGFYMNLRQESKSGNQGLT